VKRQGGKKLNPTTHMLLSQRTKEMTNEEGVKVEVEVEVEAKASLKIMAILEMVRIQTKVISSAITVEFQVTR
jgi:hypothetical protein